MTAPLTRREALAAGVCAAGLFARPTFAAPAPKADDNKSWVGKTVLPKSPDPVGAFPLANPGGEPLEAFRTLGGASWEVKAEKGTRVQVLDGDGAAGWVEKELLVPLSDAVEFYTKALKDNPNDAYTYNFRGWAKYLLGKPEEAVKDFDEFLRLVPAADGVTRRAGLSNRGLVLAEQGKFDAALKDLDEAVKLNHPPAVLNRGWAYELKGDYKKALADYQALLAARPGDALALNNLAWLRATCPDAALRDGKEAVKLARKVCELTGDREGMFLDTLAAAHAEAGDFAAAVKAQEKALEDKGFAKKQGEDAQKRLQLYKDKKPFRTTPLKAK
jgi:tetratricopeptide (TPR) repeat protein